MKRYKLIFWDFDGVIKESIEVKTEAFRQLFKGQDPSFIDDIIEHHRTHGGMPRFNKIPLYLSWLGFTQDQETVDAYCSQYSDLVKQKVIESAWVPGVKSYLFSNPFNQIFVLTSATPQQEMNEIASELNLTDKFKSIYGAPTSKDQAIRIELTVHPELAEFSVMIGDSPQDKAAARKTGIDFIARRHSHNDDLFDADTDKIVSDFNDQVPDRTD